MSRGFSRLIPHRSVELAGLGRATSWVRTPHGHPVALVRLGQAVANLDIILVLLPTGAFITYIGDVHCD